MAPVNQTSSVVTQLAQPEETQPLATDLFALRNFPVIGHRGSGAEHAAMRNGCRVVNVPENTLLSFLNAISLGAQYVEFDVQLLADGVPVIYHDYWLKGELVKKPLSLLTLCELEKLNLIKHPANGELLLKQNATKYFYGNTAPALLQEALTVLPKDLGFDIELKVPTLEEAKKEGLPPPDIATYAEKVLDCVLSFAGSRKIFFSSFQREVCQTFQLKQTKYAVYLLTHANDNAESDWTKHPLCEEANFAAANELTGIVAEAPPLLKHPELIGHIKSKGLVLLSWGISNNDVANVVWQKNMGLDGVVVDHVAAISDGLKEDSALSRPANNGTR